MQRLRRISQLGPVNLVYPAATNDRFSHSLGVCHLAGRMIDALEYESTEEKAKDKLCVQIAGLCHDLGHGPWSHVYDKAFLLGHLGIKWKHEQMSCDILEMLRRDKLKDKFEENGIGDEEFNNIKDMIEGKKKEDLAEKQQKKAYLYQIVANKDYEIDVDKWDYLKRDAQACGIPETFDFERAIQTVKICNTEGGKYRELGYRKGDALNMFYLFNKRYFLFQKVYNHKVSYGAEIMLAEAMARDDSIKEARKYVAEFLKLDDTSCMTRLKNKKEDKKLQEILKQLEERQLYQHIFDKPCDCDKVEDVKFKMKETLEREFKNMKDNITIKHVKFNLDELKAMPLYEKKNPEEGNPVDDPKEVSRMLPKEFQECFIRVYRKKDKQPGESKFVDRCKDILQKHGV